MALKTFALYILLCISSPFHLKFHLFFGSEIGRYNVHQERKRNKDVQQPGKKDELFQMEMSGRCTSPSRCLSVNITTRWVTSSSSSSCLSSPKDIFFHCFQRKGRETDGNIDVKENEGLPSRIHPNCGSNPQPFGLQHNTPTEPHWPGQEWVVLLKNNVQKH